MIYYSTLDDVEAITNGKIKLPHFTGKAKVQQYAEESKIPATYVAPGFYAQNLVGGMKPKPNEQGIYTLSLPWKVMYFLVTRY